MKWKIRHKVKKKDGPSKQKKTKLFRDSWLTTWLWLENTEKGMQCSLCLRHKKNNAFTTANCTNYRTSTFIRHARTTDHTEALKTEALHKEFKKASQVFILI